MPLDIPTYDIVKITKGCEFRCYPTWLTQPMVLRLQKDKEYIGTADFKRYITDPTPVLILDTGFHPSLFPEKALYIKGNPIPHHVIPEQIKVWNKEYWVYQIYFL